MPTICIIRETVLDNAPCTLARLALTKDGCRCKIQMFDRKHPLHNTRMGTDDAVAHFRRSEPDAVIYAAPDGAVY